MTRVMYFTDAPYFGGAERYLELLISALNREAYEPCVVTTGGARLRDFRERLRKTGVTVFEISLGGPLDVPGYIELLRIVRKWKPDVLHVNLPGAYDAQACLVAPVAQLARRVRVVTTEHLAMVEGTRKRRLAKRFGTLFVGTAISITQSNVEFISGSHGVPLSRIVVIHNGVDIAQLDKAVSSHLRSSIGIEDSAFVFVTVGSLVERKGHRYLIDAFARLCVSHPDRSALVVVGEGDEEASLRRRCSDLGLGARVFFLGHREDVQSIMLDADCLVVPSIVEGMPFVILEAMTASKPVIASRIHGIPEVIVEEETGLLTHPRDVDSLYEAMRRMVERPALSRRMGAAGRRRIEAHFSHERMARETERVYDKLLSGGTQLRPIP